MKLTKISERGQSVVEFAIILLIIGLIVWCIAAGLQTPNRITDERALTRIASMQEVSIWEIEVLYSTDNSPWTGETYDVSYDIVIKEVRKTARCTVSSWRSDMVCRVYTGDE